MLKFNIKYSKPFFLIYQPENYREYNTFYLVNWEYIEEGYAFSSDLSKYPFYSTLLLRPGLIEYNELLREV